MELLEASIYTVMQDLDARQFLGDHGIFGHRPVVSGFPDAFEAEAKGDVLLHRQELALVVLEKVSWNRMTLAGRLSSLS